MYSRKSWWKWLRISKPSNHKNSYCISSFNGTWKSSVKMSDGPGNWTGKKSMVPVLKHQHFWRIWNKKEKQSHCSNLKTHVIKIKHKERCQKQLLRCLKFLNYIESITVPILCYTYIHRESCRVLAQTIHCSSQWESVSFQRWGRRLPSFLISCSQVPYWMTVFAVTTHYFGNHNV